MSDSVKISQSLTGFEYWTERPYLSEQLRLKLKKANLLLVPWEHLTESQAVFPIDSAELWRFLQDKGESNGINLDICIEEDDYTEVALHSEVLRLPDILLQWVIVPIVVNLIAAHIYELLGKRRAKKATVHSSLMIQLEESKKVIRLNYDGPAESYERTMLEAINSFSANNNNTSLTNHEERNE